MAGTPKRTGGPQPGSEFVSDTLAANVKLSRISRHMNQQDLAERMAALGHQWVRQTVSEVERGSRAVNVEELVSLALALQVTVAALLDPALFDLGHTTDVGVAHQLGSDELLSLITGVEVNQVASRLGHRPTWVQWEPDNTPGGFVSTTFTVTPAKDSNPPLTVDPDASAVGHELRPAHPKGELTVAHGPAQRGDLKPAHPISTPTTDDEGSDDGAHT